jgi:hypothetical protein
MKRLEELNQYSSPEDAHEAYGYGYITWDEYEQIRQNFETSEEMVSPVGAAKDELRTIIARLEKDIRYFEWEGLSDEEKHKIEQQSEKRRNGRLNKIEEY